LKEKGESKEGKRTGKAKAGHDGGGDKVDGTEKDRGADLSGADRDEGVMKGTITYEVPGAGPWFSTVTLSIVIIVTLLSALIAGPWARGFLLVPALLAFVLLVFVVPAHFGRHELTRDGAILKYGWFTMSIPYKNIIETEYIDATARTTGLRATPPWSPSGPVMYMLKSGIGVVRMKLDRPQKVMMGSRLISEVFVNVDRPARFTRTVNRRIGIDEARAAMLDGTSLAAVVGRGRIIDDGCPHCGRVWDERPGAKSSTGKGSGPATGPFAGSDVEDGHKIVNIFLVHKDGRLVTTYTSGEVRTKDSYSVTAMLTIIQDFVGDALENKGSLKTLEHGRLLIIIETGDLLYLAVVLAGEVPDGLKAEMRKALREIETDHGERFREWDGSLSDLEDIKKTIGQVLWV